MLTSIKRINKLIVSIILLLLFAHLSFGQKTIIGNVIDRNTNEPIPFATVYINGTTKGTITNILGDFKLEKVYTPCDLVVSHISYHTEITHLNHEFSALSVSLKPNVLNLKPIDVVDKNLRIKNLQRFKDNFLGSDFWGKNSEILNDSILHFTTKYDYFKYNVQKEQVEYLKSKNDILWSKDSSVYFVEKESEFKTKAYGPIIIDKPALGYKMYADLFNFTITKLPNNQRSSSLGYYYFQPYDSISKRDQKVITKNRQRAYYNSTQHFCRSLFDSTLAENGFRIYDIEYDSLRRLSYLVECSLDSFIIRHHDYLEIVGLKDKIYSIAYFYKSNYRPRNMNGKVDDWQYHISKITFESDTCQLYKAGNIPNNNIVFSGAIATKLIGAFLPDDYDPNKPQF